MCAFCLHNCVAVEGNASAVESAQLSMDAVDAHAVVKEHVHRSQHGNISPGTRRPESYFRLFMLCPIGIVFLSGSGNRPSQSLSE